MTQLSTVADIKAYEAKGFPELPANSYEALARSANKHQDRPALSFFVDGKNYDKGLTWSYSQFMEQVHAAANLFHAHGLGFDDTVSILLPNLPEHCFALFGAEACGIANPINFMLEAAHIADILNAAETKILVTLDPQHPSKLWQKIEHIIPQVKSLTTVLTVSMGHYYGLPNTFVPFEINGVKVLDFNAELAKQNKNSLDFTWRKQQDDIASYFHTGGTTGSPKLAQRSHLNELTNSIITYDYLQITDKKVILCGLPWFHVNAVIATGMLPLYHGHEIVLATPIGYRDIEVVKNLWAIVEHFKVSFFSAVPTILKALLNIPIGNKDISSLDYVICGAAPLSEKLFKDFQDATQLNIIEGYGFTEGTCVNTLNPIYGEKRIGSIGLGLPFHTLKVAKVDDKGQYIADAATNEIGLLIAKGPNIIKGYKNSAHNVNAYINDGTETWYNTGDLGKQDAEGYFWISGRKKELIIRGGHNIDPKFIEEPLSQHPAVAAVAAVARPDVELGELPVAYIELKKDASASVEELMDFAKAHITERAAIPKFIYIIEQLPLTAVGKIFKPDLENRQILDVITLSLEDLAGIDKLSLHIDMSKTRIVHINIIKQADTSLETLENSIANKLGHYIFKIQVHII